MIKLVPLALLWRLGVNEGNHDVSCPASDGQSLMVVSETPGVHRGPAKT